MLGKSDSQVLPPRKGQLGVAAGESSFGGFGVLGLRYLVYGHTVGRPPAVNPIGAACYCCLDVSDGWFGLQFITIAPEAACEYHVRVYSIAVMNRV